MEAISSLTFKGSIPEAIFEAKKQKKLFVVYISGEDEESNKLNTLAWPDASVAESLSKYCILLHIQAESVDATNFSAIYPYSSVPCIAAIGFSGTQVWKNEGFIAAEVLASSLEKAWLGLHIQETTASILSAALASQNSEQPVSSASNVALPSDGGSLEAPVAPLSTNTSIQPTERNSTVTSASTKENNDGSVAVKAKKSAEPSNLNDAANRQPASSVEGTKGNTKHGKTSSQVQTEKEPIRPASPKPNDDNNTSSVQSLSTKKENQSTLIKKADSGSGVTGRDITSVKPIGTKETVKLKDEGEEEVKITKNSTDVHLNIRLPDGANLQEKFSVTSILRMVKEYVNSNQTNELGAYDLAIPYPRKVYSDQDLDKSLSELGLFDRQALIVVPRKRGTVNQRGSSYSNQTSSVSNNTDPENVNNGGYFAHLRRLLSYANPFSYLGGSANATTTGPESQSSMWEYRPNPGLRSNPARADDQDRSIPSTRDPSEGTSNVRKRRATTSRNGSNIHTLNHDEDDTPFGDGNAFWNGNSTQYGGGGGGDNNDRR